MSTRSLARSSSRPPRPVRRHWASPDSVHVVVDWSGEAEPGAVVSSRVELEAATEGSNREPRWICRVGADASWEQALLAAGSPEVVLTAELGDDAEGKHLVFGLAEHLTRCLTTSQMVRVRFLPSKKHRAGAAHFQPQML